MAKGYHHLTHPQRCQIQALKSIGLQQVTIAETIGVSAATISRELRRNRGQRGYRHKQADRLATQRRHQASATPSRLKPALIATITARLMLGWSPEQIAGRLRREGVTWSQ
jgi:IS30 family transposase